MVLHGDTGRSARRLALALGPARDRADLWPDDLGDEQVDEWLGRAWAQRERFASWRGVSRLEQLLRRTDKMLGVLRALDARPVFVDSDEFPTRLLRVPGAPSVVFVRGVLPADGQRCVAIVGSRAAYQPAVALASTLARTLAAQGHVVVSGGALGIDAAAHQGSLEGGGQTVAMLGCGLDIDYPERHAGLFARIAGEGALVTPYAPGEPPRRGHFPRRNGLLTAMSDLVVVVEARNRSGALNTAGWAQRLGVGLVAFPISSGGRQLIARGVPPVDNPEDVLAALAGDMRRPPTVRETFGDDADRALSLLRESRGDLDELASRAGTPVARMAMLLLQLELAGHVVRRPDGSYVSPGEGEGAGRARPPGAP